MLGFVAGLSVLGLASAYALYGAGDSKASVLARLFLLDEEANVPTLFAFAQLSLCWVLLALVAVRRIASGEQHAVYWLFLAAIFFLMAFDEAASLHERTIPHLRAALDVGGWLYFAWVIPAIVFLGVLGAAYLRFLLALPRPIMRLFLLAGAIYVAGALVVEMPEGAYAQAHGFKNVGFHLFATVEETLEMAGLAVFAYALLRLLGLEQRPAPLPFRIA